jgi:hypothetical protein
VSARRFPSLICRSEGRGHSSRTRRRPRALAGCSLCAQSQAPSASAARWRSRTFIAVPAHARDVSAPSRPPPSPPPPCAGPRPAQALPASIPRREPGRRAFVDRRWAWRPRRGKSRLRRRCVEGGPRRISRRAELLRFQRSS